ncbi:ImpA family metalloprotease [Crenobacter caeni]|uniref:Peptidase M60 domain-containing protein n=1 Tax=Crenobacter caeni TaxID=2705474 RepID=A0A6B2KS11_9NEIS|nr:ImpA family metalloprotease [Crenobacter caeni]NDV12914.1 hypothetical protein [Crenobacter caeni]
MNKLWLLAMPALLAGCLGGGGSGQDSAQRQVPQQLAQAEAPAVAETQAVEAIYPYEPIGAALQSGDASELPAEAAPALLAGARQLAEAARFRQLTQLTALLPAGVSQGYDFGSNSRQVWPASFESGAPLVIADNGAVLAAAAEADGGGRAQAWGGNVLWNMANASRAQQGYFPFFKNSIGWLLGGSGSAFPATVRYATHAYPGADVSGFLTRAGAQAKAVSCAIEQENSCWQGVDLFVFGQGSSNSEATAAQVRRYLAAGKAVLYLQSNWNYGPERLVSAMGLTLSGAYGGQYWSKGSVAPERTVDASLQKADEWGALAGRIALADALANDALAQWNTGGLTAAVDRIAQEKSVSEAQGQPLFGAEGSNYLRYLVLWADVARRSVDYGPVSRTGNAAGFLRALASDSWSYAVRGSTTTPQTFGDWMPPAVRNLAPSAAPEEVVVTIAQGGGRTAIGRGALPGAPVEVEVVDDAGASSLALRIGHIRARGNPLADNYDRPRYPDGHQVTLPKGRALTLVYPWGGPLFLDYQGLAAGRKVTLRLKGVTRYAHFDFTQPMSADEMAQAVGALSRGDYGWQTAKFEGGEVQQTIAKAKSVIGSQSPEQYVLDGLKVRIFDSNHLVNGYANMPLQPKVAELCREFGWTCAGDMHRAPSVQHFVGWIAACGFLCSGNPSDGFAGLAPGWGWWHELGHNTVPRSQKLVFEGKGCVTECDNNILANASALRQYALNGSDVNGDRIDHKGLYNAAKLAVDQGKTGAALQQDVYARFWVGASQNHNAMRAVHFQLAYLYTLARYGTLQPEALQALEFFTLLSKGDRLVAKAWDTADKGKYAMGRYAGNSIANHELLYVLSSKIIGRDLRQLFELYGIPLSATAVGSVADLNLPLQSPMFFALAPGRGNQLASGKWVSLSAGMPAYPF